MTARRSLESVPGLTVLITGAGRGMGEIFARRAHAEGARRLILWDADASSLEALAAELRTVEGEIQVQARAVDLRSQSSIQQTSAQVVAQGILHGLVNNPGVVTGRLLARSERQGDESIVDSANGKQNLR